MANKLVAIINSLKLTKIKKMSLYEMKFLVPHYSCLQNPWLGGYRPQIPVDSVLCPQQNLLNRPPEQNSWVRHCYRVMNFLNRMLWRTREGTKPRKNAFHGKEFHNLNCGPGTRKERYTGNSHILVTVIKSLLINIHRHCHLVDIWNSGRWSCH